MTERENIYVDLSIVPDDEIDTSYDEDKAIICTGDIGGEQYPLSLNQLRRYLKFRIKKLSHNTINFYFKDVTPDDIYLENSVRSGTLNDLFVGNMYEFLTISSDENSHKTINFKQWPNDNESIVPTIKINLNADKITNRGGKIPTEDNKSTIIYLSNITLNIENIQIQPHEIYQDSSSRQLSSLIFIHEKLSISPDGRYSNVSLNNCRILSNGDGNYTHTIHPRWQPRISLLTFNETIEVPKTSLGFVNITNLCLINNLIVSRNDNISNIFISDDSILGRNNTQNVLYNNIFLNQNILRYCTLSTSNIWDRFRMMEFYSHGNVYSIDKSDMGGNNVPSMNTGYNRISTSITDAVFIYSLSLVDVYGTIPGTNYGDTKESSYVLGTKLYRFPNMDSSEAHNRESSIDFPMLKFGIPEILNINTSDVDDWTNEDLKYTGDSWKDITVSGGRLPSNINPLNFNSDMSFGRRDGVGALYFPEMPIPYIKKLDNIIINVPTTIETGDVNYDDYLPEKYEWSIRLSGRLLNTFTTDSRQLEYTFVENGSYKVQLSTTSYNGWYIIEAEIRNILVFGGEEKTVELTLYKIPFNSSEPEDVINNEITVFDRLMISVTDNIENQNIFIEDSGVFWDLENRGDNQRFITQYSGGRDEYYSPTYTSVGDYNVVFAARYNDRISYYETFPITVVDNIQDVLYVDLLESYSNSKKILGYNYFLIDNFKLGSIKEEWNSSFTTGYNVKEMWDENVAYGTDEVTIIDGIGTEDFSIEFSFLRITGNDIPKFIFKSKNGEEDYSLDISWSFINDRIILDDGTNKNYIKYDVGNKDLLCPDSVRKINFMITNEANSDQVIVRYKINDDVNWITGKVLNVSIYDSIQLLADCTNDVGIGYLSIKTQSITAENNMNKNGSENYPITFEEFKKYTEDGTPNINTKFLLRNYRTINSGTFNIADNMFYEIDAWDNSKYGPWVLKFGDDFNNPVKFSGTKISNGIIFNTLDQKTKLHISFLYNMFVVWNSEDVVLVRSKWKYTNNDKRTDIKGSTLYNANKYSTKMIEIDL